MSSNKNENLLLNLTIFGKWKCRLVTADSNANTSASASANATVIANNFNDDEYKTYVCMYSVGANVEIHK